MSDEHSEHLKGILKLAAEPKRSKNFQWDEMNILATYHPADKDYGHMKVDEPDTPYNYEYNPNDPSASLQNEGVSAEALASRLGNIADEPLKMLTETAEISAAVPDAEELERKRDFEAKRKAHYDEFFMVHAKSTNEDDDADDEIDPVALRNAQLNAQLGKSRPFGPIEDIK